MVGLPVGCCLRWHQRAAFELRSRLRGAGYGRSTNSTQRGGGPTPLTLTADDLAKMPRATATLTSDGSTDTYEGVLLYDILVKAGWQFGHSTMGKNAPTCLVATGKDGFRAVFALAEIDPQFSGVKVLIADKENGLPLPDRYKPFRVISPQDKMRARSIYSLVKLEVVKLP